MYSYSQLLTAAVLNKYNHDTIQMNSVEADAVLASLVASMKLLYIEPG